VPLQRWLNESPQNESWAAITTLQPIFELTEGPKVTAKDNFDNISIFDATHTISDQWSHDEVLREENNPVSKRPTVKELGLKDVGAQFFGATELFQH
jgi:hypothetical protein